MAPGQQDRVVSLDRAGYQSINPHDLGFLERHDRSKNKEKFNFTFKHDNSQIV